jgi:hypothetical protein
MSYFFIISTLLLLIVVIYSKKEELLLNRFKTAAKIYAVWFGSMFIWFLLTWLIIYGFGDYILVLLQIPEQDGEITLMGVGIWSALILSLLTKWRAIRRYKI